MGIYVNPNNRKFCKVLKAGNYVDKTGLISYINSVLGTKDCETVFTRPRRFSKTTACKMLEAYYSAGADSEDLFKGREIEKDPTYREHLNKHPVISFDLLAFKDKWKKLKPKKEKPAMMLPSSMIAISKLSSFTTSWGIFVFSNALLLPLLFITFMCFLFIQERQIQVSNNGIKAISSFNDRNISINLFKQSITPRDLFI